MAIPNAKTVESGEEVLARIRAKRIIIARNLTPRRFRILDMGSFSICAARGVALCIQSVTRIEKLLS